MSLTPPYTYTAVVVRVVDGDTVVLDVDLGFGFWRRSSSRDPVSFRLAGCNAIEKSKPGGKETHAYLAALLPLGTAVLLTSVVNDKYGGRYDARIEVEGLGDLATHLIAAGWAKPWDGRGAPPVPVWPRVPAVAARVHPLGSPSDYALAKSAPRKGPPAVTVRRFRKKPIVIEAVRMREVLRAAVEDWDSLPDWVRAAYDSGELLFLPEAAEIGTPEGRMTGGPGDWLIRGVQGELYPCKPDIFDKTYEAVE